MPRVCLFKHMRLSRQPQCLSTHSNVCLSRHPCLPITRPSRHNNMCLSRRVGLTRPCLSRHPSYLSKPLLCPSGHLHLTPKLMRGTPSRLQAVCMMNLIRSFIKPRSYTTPAPIGNNWFRCCAGIVGISIPMWPKFHTAPPICSTAYASQALLSPPAPPHGANNVSSLPYSVVPTNRLT
jgi:hypothetical protein